MARGRHTVDGYVQLSPFGSTAPTTWELGVLEAGETLASTRLSVAAGGSTVLPLDPNPNGWMGSLAAVGVTLQLGGSDPGPPEFSPLYGDGTDWVLREGFGFTLDSWNYDDTGIPDTQYYRDRCNNPMVSKGMRKVPEGQGGWVYFSYDDLSAVFGTSRIGVAWLTVTWSLIIINAT